MNGFAAVVMWLTLGLVSDTNLVQDYVDLIEVNHFYDDQGRLVFDQVIFYDWCTRDCRYHVRAWRLMKEPCQHPTKDFGTGEYITIWHDGDTLRRVRSRALQETWTQYDPELRERGFLPNAQRKQLHKLRTVTDIGVPAPPSWEDLIIGEGE